MHYSSTGIMNLHRNCCETSKYIEMTTDVIEFIDNEAGYLTWVKGHSSGYVLNTERSKNRNYMVLHGAWCSQIKDYRQTDEFGKFTMRGYIKICAPDVEGLREWVRQHGRSDGTFSSDKCGCLK